MTSWKNKGWTIEIVGTALLLVGMCFLWNQTIALIIFAVAFLIVIIGASLRHFSPPFNESLGMPMRGNIAFLIQVIPRTDKELSAVCFSFFFIIALFSSVLLWLSSTDPLPFFWPGAVVSIVLAVVGMPSAWQAYYGRWLPWSRWFTNLVAVSIVGIIAWRLLVSIYST